MSIDRGDRRYTPGVDKKVEVVGCLIHSHIPAVQTYRVREIGNFGVVEYGLCKKCNYALKMDKKGFAVILNEELSRRVDKLNEKEGEEKK